MAPHRATLFIALAATAVPVAVHAVGFGRVTPNAVLGQPLAMVVPIRLDQGEQLYAECIQAEVVSGDSTLPSSQVRVSVSPTANPAEWNARISTTAPLLEPVVEVSVSAGCEKRFMRRFTALVDPPVMGLTSPVLSSPRLLERPLAADVSRAPASASRGERSATSRGRNERSAPRESVARVAPKAKLEKAPTTAQAGPTLQAAQDRQVARLVLDVGTGPRLRMDMEDPVFMPAGAASAALAADDPWSADAERLKLLQKTLSDLQKETAAYRSQEAGLKARLAEAEGRSRLLPWLAGLLLLSLAGGAWLIWRGRQPAPAKAEPSPLPAPEASAGENSWWSAGQVPPEAVPPAPGDEVHSGAMLVTDLDGAAPSPYERTRPFMPSPLGDPQASITDGQVPAREVSVEELLDLEQQADFFIALGQEDAAVDLLMSHLRGTGGQSPLPYTKLLEIYRRQDDRTAYERIRARFNRRFNAYAPDWEQGPQHGRHLEEYADVVLRLQGLWHSPLNAMAVLEAMLFRNDDQQELFDLPAYKDVLLLYSLARDLYQQDGVTAEDVDLLLPLGDDGAFSISASPAQEDVSRDNAFDLTAFSLEPRHTDAPPSTLR